METSEMNLSRWTWRSCSMLKVIKSSGPPLRWEAWAESQWLKSVSSLAGRSHLMRFSMTLHLAGLKEKHLEDQSRWGYLHHKWGSLRGTLNFREVSLLLNEQKFYFIYKTLFNVVQTLHIRFTAGVNPLKMFQIQFVWFTSDCRICSTTSI